MVGGVGAELVDHLEPGPVEQRMQVGWAASNPADPPAPMGGKHSIGGDRLDPVGERLRPGVELQVGEATLLERGGGARHVAADLVGRLEVLEDEPAVDEVGAGLGRLPVGREDGRHVGDGAGLAVLAQPAQHGGGDVEGEHLLEPGRHGEREAAHAAADLKGRPSVPQAVAGDGHDLADLPAPGLQELLHGLGVAVVPAVGPDVVLGVLPGELLPPVPARHVVISATTARISASKRVSLYLRVVAET